MEEQNKKKLRVCWNSNAPYSPSGYGQQMAQLLPKFVKEGYPTACIAFYGLEGGIIQLDGIWMYPRISSEWGDDAMINHSKHFKADVVFTLQDLWVLDINTPRTLAQTGRRFIPVVPIDHEPVPPAIVDRLRHAYRIITYSKFGYDELKRIGIHSTFIPHTVDTSIMKKSDKKEARKKVGLPEDAFIFGMVGANKDNPPRKGYQHALDAFAMFKKKYPNSAMYLHTMPRLPTGFPIYDYAKVLGIEESIFTPESYEHLYTITQADMARVYSLMDVFLLPSLNEGFGVPLIEAQACEVPVIATDFTAMRDLVIDGVTGFKLKVKEKKYTPLQSYIANPDTEHLYELMIKMYEMKEEERLVMGKNARKFVVENYGLNLVWKKCWRPFLEGLEEEIYRN